MATTDILFVSHGGGPLPLLGDPGHRDMVRTLQQLTTTLPRPDAILVISAHWESDVPTLTGAARPQLVYDYHGFPAQSYRIEYPCPGSPALAGNVRQTLQQAGLPARQDSERGLDHGVFVPLKILYPEADIPVVQLSLIDNLAPEQHLKLGRALRALVFDGRLLVIGSGFTFHNMRSFTGAGDPHREERIEAFSEWLRETCCSTHIDEGERLRRLADWARAPHARFCHPREEHLLPLLVCAGLAGRPCETHIRSNVMDTRADMYHWPAG